MTGPDQAELFAEVARAAHRAPSAYNTQPWRWRVHPDHLDLYADRSRQLRVADPEGRLLLLSCGAALHHAAVTLAARGWRPVIARWPIDDPDRLARVGTDGSAIPPDEVVRQEQAIPERHTDRRPIGDQVILAPALAALRQAVEGCHAHLHLLRPREVSALAVAADQADTHQRAAPGWFDELAYWVGGARPPGTGLPEPVFPTEPLRTHIPSRDLGRIGPLSIGGGGDRAATYAVLFGEEDSPAGWLTGGEALSAAWLTATAHGLAVLPFSSVVVAPPTRAVLHWLLAGIGYPYLVLRIGRPVPDLPPPAPTDRLAPEQVIELAEDPR